MDALIIAVAVFALVAVGLRPTVRKALVFRGRKPLSDEEFFEAYFRSLAVAPEVAVGVRTALSEALGADLLRISSKDDLSKNLSFFYALDSMADVELMTALEETFQIEISDDEWLKVGTIEEIVLLVDRKVKSAVRAP